MTEQRDVELIRKVGQRLSLVVRGVTNHVHGPEHQVPDSVIDAALASINHKGLHANWNLIRTMVGVDPV